MRTCDQMQSFIRPQRCGDLMTADRYDDARDGSKLRSKALISSRSYGFPALKLSDHSPMLFVDLLTRPGHQGEALREPRLRHRLDLDNSPVSSACVPLLLFNAIPPMGGWGVHTIKIRPIYHWTPQRVRAHIAICYMAFCCVQHLRMQLNTRPPDESGPHPKGTDRCAGLDSSPQGHT